MRTKVSASTPRSTQIESGSGTLTNLKVFAASSWLFHLLSVVAFVVSENKLRQNLLLSVRARPM